MNRKQTPLGTLLHEQNRFDTRRLAASYVEMAGALPCRPEPRHLFDNAASPGRVSYYGDRLIIGADAVLSAAIALRDPSVLEQTAKRVAHHVEDLESRMLQRYTCIASGSISLNDAADAAARETADLSAALTHWALRHDDASRDETIREIDAEILRLTTLRAQLYPAPIEATARRIALV